MKTQTLAIAVLSTTIFNGCAATVPLELVNAREAYRQASVGPAADVALAELHVAALALAEAERSFQQSPDSFQTRDLAYVAERKSELATATASTTYQQRNEAQAKLDYQTAQGKIVNATRQDLAETRSALSASQQSGAAKAEQLTAEQTARAAAEKRAADAQAALARLASVKEEPRGTVITLSGSVLFASNQSVLLPEARARLDQVVAVLLTTRERNIVIEGHTDSNGTDAHNQELSQRRADAVREYIVARGYEADRIQSHGLGESHPVADNAGPEGRANNRRVEIVVARETHASNL